MVRKTMRDLVAVLLPDFTNSNCSDAYDHFTAAVTRIAEDILVLAVVTASRPWISNSTLRLVERRNAARFRGDR